MASISAREMLSQLPLRMADGGEAVERSGAYRRAFEQNGEDGVQAYYASLREVAQTYLADTDAPTGAEAYNIMVESGISTTDLINAGVGQEVLTKIFTITEDPSTPTYGVTAAESAFIRNPVLAAEAARRSAEGLDGVADLQQQARDYVADIKKGGITDAERAEMQRIATERGITVQDFIDTGVDTGILFKGTYCPPGTKLEGQPIPADGNCNPEAAVCEPGTKLAGQPIPADGNCNPEDAPAVCEQGTKLAGQPIPADGNCNPEDTPTVCEQGTRLAGQPIPADGNCNPTTKVCPAGSRLDGQTVAWEDDCNPATKVCPSGSKLDGQTVAWEADCNPTTKVCPTGTKKAGETIPFEDDCDAEEVIRCPLGSKLEGQPVPADGDCNPPDLCPVGSELEGQPIPTDGDCDPTKKTKLCPPGTQLEGQQMPANGDCNPEKFPTTQVCAAGTELEGQTIAIEASCNPTADGGGGDPPVTVYGQTKVCPAGTALAGMTIAKDADCNDTTTKATKDPGTYAPGVPAIDTEFRESAPRTKTDVPGQFAYTPAAKLMPATGSGLSWTPPGVTGRPRSLLSPETVRGYGGFTSASQRFAQNRRDMDKGILGAFREANVYDPSAIREFRQQARAGLFSDDAGFNLDQFKTAFDNWLSTRSATGGTDTDTDTDTTPNNWWNRGGYGGGDPFTDADRSGAYGQGEMGDWPSGEEMGYFGPITPVDLRYGVPGVFAKGGPVNKSARAMLAEFSNGGAVNANRTPLSPDDPLYIHEGTPSAAEIDFLRQNLPPQQGSLPQNEPQGTPSAAEIDFLRQNLPQSQPQGTPSASEIDFLRQNLPQPQPQGTPSATEIDFLRQNLPRNTDQTESASMLESIIEGASMIPETVGNYFVRPNEAGGTSLVSPRQVGSDLKTLGGTMWDAAKEEPLSFLLDMLPIIGEIRSGADVDKFTDLANEAEAAGDTRMADIYRQIVTLSAAGALPLAGMGARATRRGAISSAEEAATTSARRMLDDVESAGASNYLANLDNIAAATGDTITRRAPDTDVPYIRFSDEYAAQVNRMLPEPTNNNGYPGADLINAKGVKGDPIAEAFNRQIAEDPLGMIELYKKLDDSDGGKVHDTDAFRELSPNYLADRTIATSIHEPASHLNEMFYNMKVAETQGQPGNWLFTGGGPASGKSSGPAGLMREGADLVYDGTLADYDAIVPRIDAALNSGKQVEVAFVLRDPEKAIRQAAMRAMGQKADVGSGRTIPINWFAGMHVDARNTVKRLNERYADNDAFKITVTNNQGGINDARLGTLDEIAEIEYDETVRRVTSVLEEMRNEGTIDEDIYAGFIRNTDLEAPSSPTTSVPDTRGTPTKRGDGQAASQNDSQLGQLRSQVSVETPTAATTSARRAL